MKQSVKLDATHRFDGTDIGEVGITIPASKMTQSVEIAVKRAIKCDESRTARVKAKMQAGVIKTHKSDSQTHIDETGCARERAMKRMQA